MHDRLSIIGAGGVNTKSNWSRLCGALTMLALLGTPWLLSAFGLIDAKKDGLLQFVEGVFNVSSESICLP